LRSVELEALAVVFKPARIEPKPRRVEHELSRTDRDSGRRDPVVRRLLEAILRCQRYVVVLVGIHGVILRVG
jgi:hypothetical protein